MIQLKYFESGVKHHKPKPNPMNYNNNNTNNNNFIVPIKGPRRGRELHIKQI